jgi:membrane associated rhomboid family serine protease
MVIPLYDDDPLDQNPYAFVTWGLILINIVVWFIQLGSGDDTTASITEPFALTPASFTGVSDLDTGVPPFLTMFTYMFLHGGWTHIIFNMLFLWVFGDNIEDAMGSVRFLIFYLLCGMAGGYAHVLSNPESTVPLVGASGAIAGVVAAYLMIRPCARLTVIVFGFVPLRLGSAWVLGFWVLSQFWNVLAAEKGPTAWWAHIGGLAAGAVLVLFLRRPGVPLFECMRPGDAVVASAPPINQATTTAPEGGPWAPR